LTTCFIQKFAQNITSFVVACFINTYIFFKNNLNLTMFAQIFAPRSAGWWLVAGLIWRERKILLDGWLAGGWTDFA